MRKGFKYFLVCLLALESSWAYSPYSTKELDELEKEFIKHINHSNQVIRDPLAVAYINELGNKISRGTNLKSPDFFIVKSNEINAFAGPGGHIGINSQLILASDSEHELAAVMAHEFAHVRLHHLYRMIQHEKQMRLPLIASLLASVALGAINPALGSGAMMASLSGVAQDGINYTRANEKEADRIGIDMLINAGFDPRGMSAFFKKMQQSMRYYYTDNIPAILRTHPLDQDRIAEAENRISQTNLQQYNQSDDYFLCKELIRVLSSNDPKWLLDYYKAKYNEKNHHIGIDLGYGLALIKNNQFLDAQNILQKSPGIDNIFMQKALSEAEIKLDKNTAINRIKKIYENNPSSYAAIIFYAQALMISGEFHNATTVLKKARREFPKDLQICELFSSALSESGDKAYAYFTLGLCDMLEGHSRSAMQQLKTALKLVKNNEYLKARIKATIDDIELEK